MTEPSLSYGASAVPEGTESHLDTIPTVKTVGYFQKAIALNHTRLRRANLRLSRQDSLLSFCLCNLVALLTHPLSQRQRQIFDQIIRVLEADGDAKQSLRCPWIFARDRCSMFNQTFHSA